MEALRDDRLRDLTEEAQSSPLDAKALTEALRYLRQAGKPIPDELRSGLTTVLTEAGRFPSQKLDEADTQTRFAID